MSVPYIHLIKVDFFLVFEWKIGFSVIKNIMIENYLYQFHLAQ